MVKPWSSNFILEENHGKKNKAVKFKQLLSNEYPCFAGKVFVNCALKSLKNNVLNIAVKKKKNAWNIRLHLWIWTSDIWNIFKSIFWKSKEVKYYVVFDQTEMKVYFLECNIHYGYGLHRYEKNKTKKRKFREIQP